MYKTVGMAVKLSRMTIVLCIYAWYYRDSCRWVHCVTIVIIIRVGSAGEQMEILTKGFEFINGAYILLKIFVCDDPQQEFLCITILER